MFFAGRYRRLPDVFCETIGVYRMFFKMRAGVFAYWMPKTSCSKHSYKANYKYIYVNKGSQASACLLLRVFFDDQTTDRRSGPQTSMRKKTAELPP
ncbi:MAG: hypothetical protein JWM11_2979 [Planctomycetaceae bacterium]|nr:hypothetical protein [Planctomycetaceae bacterium]